MKRKDDAAFWHKRFTEQSQWTAQVRQTLLRELQKTQVRRILEVGCGTGAILSDPAWSQWHALGLDLRLDYLQFASQFLHETDLICGDAYLLPFADHSFDLTLSHFFFLWIRFPEQVISEMRRVTRPGGFIAALAEPDYGGRVDYPYDLVELGRLQAKALRQQSADPEIGRKLASLLTCAGLENICVGVLGAFWNLDQETHEPETENQVLETDLQSLIPSEEAEIWIKRDHQARKDKVRILYVPTFFGWGRVPES